jgi:hypothetical protein
MSVVPRLHDTLAIRPAPPLADGTCYEVVDGAGRPRLRVDEAGRFLLLQLDGVRSVEEVRARFRERFARELSPHRLTSAAARLDAAGLLVREGRGLAALRYLRSVGMRYRGPGRDRRAAPRDDKERRAFGERTLRFDRAVYLLNEGWLEAALELLQSLSAEDGSDLRVRELAGHVEFILAAENRPDIGPDRRDMEWAAFDEALADLLSRGECPACDAELVVELGAANRCGQCGASFSSYVLDRASRRRA